MTRIALLSMAPEVSQSEGAATGDEARRMLNRFPSYGVRRVQAALVADGRFDAREVMVIDRRHATAEEFVQQLCAFEPDVVGLSAYVWSLPTMLEVARTMKTLRPRTTIVFGGPSSHTAMFDLPPYSGVDQYADALVLGEGEKTFRELAALRDRGPHALATIDGLAIPLRGGGWHKTPKRVPNPDMDSIASPYQMDLMPVEHAAYLETFRGCPLSCTFCQWGVLDANRFLSTAHLVRELEAMKRTRPIFTFIIDAALNLHPRAFRNLVAAEKEVGLFRESVVLTEVYPSLLRDEHLEFLRGARAVHMGVGVQSLDPDVLENSARPFKPERLRGAIDQFLQIGVADMEIIVGLPGDTPERFKRTLEAVLEMPCSVRVYRCLVLPDGLMTRAPAGSNIRFDPWTLALQSCSTWSERELQETHQYLNDVAASHPIGSSVGDYWWLFVGSAERCRQAYGHLAARAADSSSATLALMP